VAPSSPTPDADHKFQLDGKWWTPEAATAQADADQKAKDAAQAPATAPANPTPIPNPAAVPEPIVAHPAAFTSSTVHPAEVTIIKVAIPAAVQPKETPSVTTSAPHETFQQEVGSFFKKLLGGIEKGFSFVQKVDAAAQPAITAVETAIQPFDAPLSAAIALGDTVFSGVVDKVGQVLTTVETVGATNATPAQKLQAALPQIEAEIMADPSLQKALAAVGGTPTNLAKFNTSLEALASAYYDLTTAI
jgi:hypothetical protein